MQEVASGSGAVTFREHLQRATLVGSSVGQWFTILGFTVPLPKVPVLTATLRET